MRRHFVKNPIKIIKTLGLEVNRRHRFQVIPAAGGTPETGGSQGVIRGNREPLTRTARNIIGCYDTAFIEECPVDHPFDVPGI
jgi:hypothetical protein